MPNQRRFLAQDVTHAKLTSTRWLGTYRYYSSDQPNDYIKITEKEGTSPACFKCRYYVALSGELETDWGACSNEKSPLDRTVVFEHDSCECFSFAADEEAFK